MEPLALTVDMDAMVVETAWGERQAFTLDEGARTMLREGLDMIALTLRHSAAILAFRDADRAARPWVYA